MTIEESYEFYEKVDLANDKRYFKLDKYKVELLFPDFMRTQEDEKKITKVIARSIFDDDKVFSGRYLILFLYKGEIEYFMELENIKNLLSD